MLADFNGNPPQSFCDLFITCDTNPLSNIKKILHNMSQIFCKNFNPNGPERFRLAEALYYRLLENIIVAETKMKPFDRNIFANQDIIHRTMIVCSVEIVLAAYNSERKFPWVLEIFKLEAFNFIKIIELVVRNHQDLLTRDIIKHLNQVNLFISILVYLIF